MLGGVSLFDFEQFDAEKYREKCPMSSWHEFVPWQESWGSSVWIEIHREQVRPPAFISGPDLVAKLKADKAYTHTIMPYIEAAYMGFVPKAFFKRVLIASPEGVRPFS
jgi:hypothetical protein